MEGKHIFARVRLTGARFSGGVLPIDSLEELQRYQNLIRRFAQARGDANPEELRLVIERIDDGSADILLAIEQVTVHIDEQIGARDQLEATLAAAYGDGEISEDLDWDLAADVAELGSTLGAGQSLVVEPIDDSHPRVEISVVTRPQAIERLTGATFFLPTDVSRPSHLRTESTLVAGRIVELDADNQKFRFESVQYGTMNGRYKDPTMVDEFRAVLDSAARAPVTRLVGDVQWKNGAPWRIRDVQSLERFDLDGQPWQARLTALAELHPGWGESGQEPPISLTALDAAREILSALTIAERDLPAVFPTEDGGLSIEWANARSVRSIEITADGVFEMFVLPEGQFDGTETEVSDLPSAIQFALGGDA